VSKPRLLDLYAGAGGAAKGYQRAGFYVVGVDHKPQPNYCGDEFRQCDALDFLRALIRDGNLTWDRFDVVHASPPCQAFTAYRRTGNVGEYPDLVVQTRELLGQTGLPWVIENVEGAPLRNPTMLCGSAFGLDVQRHRLFETSFPLMAPGCFHGRWRRDRFPGGRSKERTGSSRGLVRSTVEIGSWDIPLDVQCDAMGGVNWMSLEELSEAVPPSYTEFIGAALLAEIQTRAAA
jgi:DNA (cytosine-5)-methyltransferase 1